MYNANASYEENYRLGPQSQFLRQKSFPRVTYLEEPHYSFLGIPLHIPFGIPAGPLLNAAYVKAAFEAGYCLPVYKTVRTRAWESHAAPNVLSVHAAHSSLLAEQDIETVTGKPFEVADYEAPEGLSITNSFGVPSRPPAIWQQDFESLKNNSESHGRGRHAMLSFQGSRTETAGAEKQRPMAAFEAFLADSADAALLAATSAVHTGFGILEVNLSCPNEKGDPIFKNVAQAVAVVQGVKAALAHFPSVKLVAKIGVLSESDCFEFVNSTHSLLSGIAAINTVPARIVTPDGRIALGSGSEVGGICGSLILKQGVEMISRLARARRALDLDPAEFGLIGVGGVMTARDYLLYREAGADVVQAATGAMWNADLALEVANLCRVPFQVSRYTTGGVP